MESLYYEETLETPGIEFDAEKGLLKMYGKSFPEEAGKFYEPILNWLDEYSENPREKTQVIIFMEYFNSASSTRILEILYTLNNIYRNNHSVSIEWHYLDEDDDMRESGEEYDEMIQIPMKLIPEQEIEIKN